MKSVTLPCRLYRFSLALLSATLAIASAPAQTASNPVVANRLVAAAKTSNGLPDSVTATVQPNTAVVPPMPAIDSGPRHLMPTVGYLKRYLTADFEGKFTQDAAVYLPIYYHAGYLLLAPEDRLELQTLQQEVNAWIAAQEALNRRGAALLERLQAIHERGRPRGIVQESELLVPYGGSESKLEGELDPLVIERQQAAPTKTSPSAETGSARAVNPLPVPTTK